MKNDSTGVQEYLDYYFGLDSPQFAILLKGSWGSGKTYFINNLIDKLNTNETCESDSLFLLENHSSAFHAYKTSQLLKREDELILKPIYISLFGLINKEQIDDRVNKEIYPSLNKNITKYSNKLLNSFLKEFVKIDIDFLELIKNKKEHILSKNILIFDDFERCKIEIDELLGYINYYVEHLDSKVIILCNEDTLLDNEKYKSFKEKVIGHTFEILPNTTNAIAQFIKNYDKSLIELINENLQLIVDIFQVSEKRNLRLLKQMFTDIKRFLSLIDNSLNQNKNYNEFVKNLIAYFEIVYLEYKSGNEDIKYFQNAPFYEKELEKVSVSFGAKYNPLLSEYSILVSKVVLPIHLIIEYLNNGTIDKELVNNHLRNNKFFQSDKELRTWEKLWNWRYLYEDDFRETADQLWDELINTKLESFIEVLHTIGIFLELYNENLYCKDNIIQIGKEVLDKYINQNLNFNPATDVHIIYHPSSYEYSSRNNPEFQHLLDYTASTIKSNSYTFRNEDIKVFFENLTPTQISNIYQEIKELIPEYELTIRYPILKTVDGKLLLNKLINLGYKSIYDFTGFLKFVYRPDLRYSNGKLDISQLTDLHCLQRFYNELKISIDSKKPILAIALNSLSKVLEEIFIKFEELNDEINHFPNDTVE